MLDTGCVPHPTRTIQHSALLPVLLRRCWTRCLWARWRPASTASSSRRALGPRRNPSRRAELARCACRLRPKCAAAPLARSRQARGSCVPSVCDRAPCHRRMYTFRLFCVQADPPNFTQIPPDDVVGVTVILLTCSYKIQVGGRAGGRGAHWQIPELPSQMSSQTIAPASPRNCRRRRCLRPLSFAPGTAGVHPCGVLREQRVHGGGAAGQPP